MARERGISPRICPRLYPWPRNDPIRGVELFECKIRARTESALIVSARIVAPISIYISEIPQCTEQGIARSKKRRAHLANVTRGWKVADLIVISKIEDNFFDRSHIIFL